MSIAPEDRSAVLDLISEYAYTFDEDRIEELINLFAEDADWRVYLSKADEPLVKASSNAERRVVLQEVRSGPINQAGMPRHFQTNTAFRPGLFQTKPFSGQVIFRPI